MNYSSPNSDLCIHSVKPTVIPSKGLCFAQLESHHCAAFPLFQCIKQTQEVVKKPTKNNKKTKNTLCSVNSLVT